jgi:hypothetical protein
MFESVVVVVGLLVVGGGKAQQHTDSNIINDTPLALVF